jgi:protein gp37
MTKIEWVKNSDGTNGKTWNPIAGCSIVSPGCTNCYAMKQAHRIEACNAGLPSGGGGARHYAGTTKVINGKPVWTGKIGIASQDALLKPMKRRTPTTYFVNSMSDLFHENVPDETIHYIFEVMALTQQHTYQVLTKRSARMRAFLTSIQDRPDAFLWPLPNVWLGVSIERQKEYDLRAPDLRETPAAVRFFSMEPLLGPIVAPWLGDWVIVGGESGPGARPMHPDWARSLRDQCAAAGVPFFFKQWGAWKDGSDFAPDAMSVLSDGRVISPTQTAMSAADREQPVMPQHPTMMRKVGKKAAGRLLDGVTHDGMPEAMR